MENKFIIKDNFNQDIYKRKNETFINEMRLFQYSDMSSNCLFFVCSSFAKLNLPNEGSWLCNSCSLDDQVLTNCCIFTNCN